MEGASGDAGGEAAIDDEPGDAAELVTRPGEDVLVGAPSKSPREAAPDPGEAGLGDNMAG